MDQRGEQYVNVPRPHQQAEFLIDRVLIREILPHEAARHDERDEQQSPENEVETTHLSLDILPPFGRYCTRRDWATIVPMRTGWIALLVAASLSTACSGGAAATNSTVGNTTPDATPSRTAETPAASATSNAEGTRADEEEDVVLYAEFGGTAGATENKNPTAGVALLTAVRTSRHQSFDRVVFEFSGDRPLPGYRVE